MVLAADHVRDLHLDVVDDVDEVEDRFAVRAEDHEVAVFDAGDEGPCFAGDARWGDGMRAARTSGRTHMREGERDAMVAASIFVGEARGEAAWSKKKGEGGRKRGEGGTKRGEGGRKRGVGQAKSKGEECVECTLLTTFVREVSEGSARLWLRARATAVVRSGSDQEAIGESNGGRNKVLIESPCFFGFSYQVGCGGLQDASAMA